MSNVPRHDAKWIKAIAKYYGLEWAKHFQRLPFFFIPTVSELDLVYKVEGMEDTYRVKEEYQVYLTDTEQIENLLPFNSFCVVMEDGGFWFSVHYRGDNEWHIFMPLYDQSQKYVRSRIYGATTRILLNIGTDVHSDGTVGVDMFAEYLDGGAGIPSGYEEGVEQAIAKINENGEARDATNELLAGTLEKLICYFKWAESRHLVKVRPPSTKADLKAKKKGDLKPWTRTDRPHYIFLNAPQTEAEHPVNETPEEEKRRVRGHHRRAHFRTLRHPKFRHHPDYMKPVRRKATWVGPRDWVVEGTIYTLVDDHEGDDDDDDKD